MTPETNKSVHVMNANVIPVEIRYPHLRASLLAFAQAVVAAMTNPPDLLAAGPKDIFWALALPWILELDVINPLPELRAIIDQRKAVISQSGFDGKSIAESLRQIRNGDPHLAECCPTLLHLARHLSFNFIHDCTLLLRQGGNDPQIDQLYESFLKLTYEQGPFRRAAFTHVFNLDIDGRDVTIENFRIIRLNPDSKSELLKEDGISRYIHPFLHPQGVGDCFIYANEGANDQNDDSWLQAKHAEATRFVMLLQYFKDGVVHVGYTVPRFYPDWAHQIRYEGLYLIGTPRRTAHSHGGLNTKSRRLKFPRFQDIGLLFPHRTYQQ